MTSDVIRCRYMSYNPLISQLFTRHNFAKSEPMDGLEHLPTDSSTPLTFQQQLLRWTSLFNEQSVVFCTTEIILPYKNVLPPIESRDFPPKSENLTEKANNPKKQKKHGEKQARRTGRKLKTDPRIISTISV